MSDRKFDIGYFSSADRGLDVLLQAIPEIEKRLGRKVTSTWAYGWDIYDKFHRNNPEKMKWKWQVIKAMNETGMVAQGRLSHEELAVLMEDTKVWAYPTSFPEIHCITAVKAQAAKCKVVTTGFAALQETVLQDEKEYDDIHANPETLEVFIDRVVKALQEPRDEEALEKTKQAVIASNDWSAIAKRWSEALS